VFYCIVFIFLVLFRNKQPLKSRGIRPFAGLIVSIVHLLSKMNYFFNSIEIISKTCFLSYLVLHPALVTLGFILNFHYFRVLILFFLNKKKILFVQNKFNTSILFRYNNLGLKLLKMIMHPIFNLIMVMFVFISCQLIFGSIYVSFNFQCSAIGYTIERLLYNALIFFFALFIVVLFIIDFCFNFHLIRKCKLKKIYQQDSFFFRTEMVICGVFVCVPLCFLTLTISLVGVSYTFEAITFTLLMYSLDLLSYGFPLIFTMIQFIVQLFSKPKEPLEQMLNISSFREIFYEFSVSEFSQENIVCYDSIQKYKREKNTTKRKKIAEKIISEHLSGSDSILEIHSNFKNRNSVNLKIQNSNFEDNLFDKILKDIVYGMSDTYSRFILSSSYFQYSAMDKTISGETEILTQIAEMIRKGSTGRKNSQTNSRKNSGIEDIVPIRNLEMISKSLRTAIRGKNLRGHEKDRSIEMVLSSPSATPSPSSNTPIPSPSPVPNEIVIIETNPIPQEVTVLLENENEK
jgi:hypothetical protein